MTKRPSPLFTVSGWGNVILINDRENLQSIKVVEMIQQKPKAETPPGDDGPKMTRAMTLALISLDDLEDQGKVHFEESAMPTNEAKEELSQSSNEVTEEPLCSSPLAFFKDRPLWRLFVVMSINGLLSLASSALILRLEKPAQDIRFAEKEAFMRKIDDMKLNISQQFGNPSANPDATLKMIKEFAKAMGEAKQMKDEIPWDLLNAQAFITSVQTTTGYGNIVPVTTGGKMFTLLYGLIGIPVFMWYIVKLGGLFRLLTMNIFSALKACFCPTEEIAVKSAPDIRRRSTLGLILFKANNSIKEQFEHDKRFHPIVIGIIMLIFLFISAYFVYYMEGYQFFNAMYACFITYSTIGFGDLDIFRVSYRSNWMNLLIYGNFIHILGYVVVSAWISSLLEKAGVRKF